jgi:hypothetical protein
MNKSDLYLGYIKGRKVTQSGIDIGEIRPIYRATPGAVWKIIPEGDRNEEFPNRGSVTWFHAPDEATSGSVWQFRVEPQPTFEADNLWHDEFRVSGLPIRPLEVIPLNEGNPELVRRQMIEEGISISFTPSSAVYLIISDVEWVGPIKLERQSDGRWHLPLEEDNVRPFPVVQPVPRAKIATIDFGTEGNGRMFLAPDVGPLRSLGQVDWSPAPTLLRNVLNSLRTLSPTFYKQLGLTKKVITQLVSDLESAMSTAPLDRSRIQRAAVILNELLARQDAVEGFAEALLQHPRIITQLDTLRAQREQAVEAELQERRKYVEADLAARQMEVERALDTLTEAIANKRADLKRLQSEEKRRQQELEAELTHFEGALAQRLAELLERPAATFAEVAVLRAALQLPAQVPTIFVPQKSHQPLPSRWHATAPVKLLDSDVAVRKAIRDACRVVGFPSLAPSLHASFVAGAMPILLGESALALAEAYAHVVANDRLLWIPIAPDVLSPRDLLGYVDKVTGRFVPQVNGLIDVLKQAGSDPDQLFLVVLDGLNRAAIDGYLMPLLSCYQSGISGARRLLPLVHDLDLEDPYAFVTSLQWPANVLLCGIWSEGALQLPSPRSLWYTATFLPLDLVGSDAEDDFPPLVPSASSDALAVSRHYWNSLRAALPDTDLSPCHTLLGELREADLYLGREVEMLCRRYYAALRPATNEAFALSDMVRRVIVPRLLPEAERLLPFLESRRLLDDETTRTVTIAREVLP